MSLQRVLGLAILVSGCDALSAASVTAPPQRLQTSGLAAFSETYSKLASKHYLPFAFGQAAVLASGADTATQLMRQASLFE